MTNGILSTTLVPTDALSGDSANARYTCRYGLTAGQPLSPPLTETWNVPTSGPVTSLDQLRAVTPPPYTPTAAPSDGTYITKGAVSGLSAEFSLGTLVDNNILAVDVAASVGTPRAATSTDLMAISGWPAGVDMTELGYLNGVTSAIQTQLDGKLSLTGGTLTGPLTLVQQSADQFGMAVSVQKRGATGDANSAITNGAELGYWSFDGWNGSAYQRGGLAIMYATQDWSGVQAGSKMAFYTTRQGSTSNSLNAEFDQNGNFVVGDIGAASTYRLDVTKSGSSGTLRVYDQTPTTGVSSAVFQEGAGQSTGYLLQALANDGATRYWGIVNHAPQWGNASEVTCNSTNRGALMMVQGGAGVADTFRVCSKDSADAYAYRPLF